MATQLTARSEDLQHLVWHTVGILSAVIISRYDPSHSLLPMLCPDVPISKPWDVSWQTCTELKSFPSGLASYGLEDPSPRVFVGAVSMFTLATVLTHTVYKDGRPRSDLLVGVVIAYLMSSVRQFMAFEETWGQSVQYSLLPGVMVTLIISGATGVPLDFS